MDNDYKMIIAITLAASVIIGVIALADYAHKHLRIECTKANQERTAAEVIAVCGGP